MATTYKGVIRHFEKAPKQIRDFFPDFVELVERYEWEVSISYVFSRLEQAKRRTLHGGIVRLHWCDSALTRSVVNQEHLSRQRFLELFEMVYGKKIPESTTDKLKEGERVRDKIAHGMDWKPAEVRDGIVSVIDFAKELDDFVAELADFRPFGDLRGFKGRKEPLTKATTAWILKGMGILNKKDAADKK